MKRRTLFLILPALVLAATLALDASAQINPLSRSGFELADSDRPLIREALGKLFSDGEIGEIESWQNDESGNYGTATLLDRKTYKSMPCQRIQHDIRIATKGDPFRFIIDYCQTPTGEWKIL